MQDTINSIRALLTQLETAAIQADRAVEFREFSGLELPEIICDVVDLLMPELKPYEVSLYIHFLRNSIIANGTPYFRASRRGLQSGVVKSTRPKDDSGEVSYMAVQQAMAGLETVGAIRQEGDPNREGTLYRILLPEEIGACQRRRMESKRPIIITTRDEADFYNILENRIAIYERDLYQCKYCTKQLTRFTVTLDHITPVSEGGDNSAENLKTACLQCNSRKTARPLGDFLAETHPSK